MSDDLRLRAIEGHEDALATAPEGEVTDAQRIRSDLDALKEGAAMLTQAGNRVAALALMWSAVAIDPTDLGAHRRLAAMLANSGDVDGAANEYARFIDFMLPIGDVARATMELAYGAKVLGGHTGPPDAAASPEGPVPLLRPRRWRSALDAARRRDVGARSNSGAPSRRSGQCVGDL